MRDKICGIKIGTSNIQEILNSINLFLNTDRNRVMHITNLNTDIFMIAYRNKSFRSIINNSNAILIDGIGIKIMTILNKIQSGERMTGTDFFPLLVKMAVDNNKKVMFLGGKNDVAFEVGKYFKHKYPRLEYLSLNGSKNIINESRTERKRVLKSIECFKPDFLFVSYGPPYQEFWIEKNKKKLRGIVCFGVGGAFNLIVNRVKRAPKFITRIGLEWFWRLFFEPSRIPKLTPRYIQFIFLILYSLVKKT